MSRRSRYFENPYCAREKEILDVTSMRHDIDNSQRTAKSTLRAMIQRILDKAPPEHAETDGGLYVGASGIAYTHLLLAQRAATLGLDRNNHLALADGYLTPSLKEVQRREGRSGTGFLLGLYFGYMSGRKEKFKSMNAISEFVSNR
jgi:hypothetical protein